MKPTPPHNQDQDILQLLESLKSNRVEYPPDLLAARRADFIAKLSQYKQEENKETAPSGRQFTKRLKELQSVRAEYPPELLAARRAAFIAQVENLGTADVVEDLTVRDQDFLKLLKKVKSAEPGYPSRLLAARRAAFVRQVRLEGGVSLLDMLRFALQRLFESKVRIPSTGFGDALRTSAVIAMLMLAAYIAYLFPITQPILQASPEQDQAAQVVPLPTTPADDVPQIICKQGYEPPLCLAKTFDQSKDLSYQGNGVARPAVAKDTMSVNEGIHDPANVNDGLYGPGSSWVSNSPYSWIKIDLGKPTTINAIAFGRDRLGHLKYGNPGQFVIAVALSDNVYADGNSSKDYVEYTQVYHSQQDGFEGVVKGTETIRANFAPVRVRYIKIIFANPGTAVDEVEAFLASPPVVAQDATRKPNDDVPTIVWTAAPTFTTVPTNTASPVPTNTLAPTDTPLPSDTPTDVPTATNTPRPTLTPTPEPTDTPPPTRTPSPEPTNTPEPTDTPVPTDTVAPIATETTEPVIEFTETLIYVDEP